MMDAAGLALDMKSGIGQGAQPMSTQLTGLATQVVNHVVSAVVAFAPGTVTGTAPPSGGPLSNGAASNGIITLVAAALESALISVFGHDTPQIKAMADGISNHVATGLCAFASGNVTGACTNTPLLPGAFTGAGSNGTVSGLSGSAMAGLMSSAFGGTTSQLIGLCQAIADQILNNAEVIAAVLTGVCSAGGGPITLGAGSGSIS